MPEKLNETSFAEREVKGREIAMNTPQPMVTSNGINSSLVTPFNISRSASTRTADFGRPRAFGMDSQLATGDLESGYRHDSWIEGRCGSSRNRETRR